MYAFNGSSDELVAGVFLETNNSCGGELSCGTPENLVAVENDGHILLTWDAVADEGYGYNIYRDGLICRLIPAGTTTSYRDEQADLGGYCYQVAVLCDGGESGMMSNESCSYAGPCYPPRNLDYELTSNFRIKLSWEPPVPDDGLTGYVLYRKQGEGEYARVKLLNPSVLTYTDNNLNQEDDYYYRLYAYYREPDCYSSPANRKYQTNVFELHAYYSPTGVVEHHDGVKVYPNPASGKVRVEADGMTHLTAFNILGQRLLDQDVTGDSFEWNNVPQGACLLRVETEQGVFYTKILCMD